MPRPVTRTQAALSASVTPAPTTAACADAPAVPATAADEVEWLCELPDALLQILLRALAGSGSSLRGGEAEGVAKSLLRLAATCKHLRCAVAALDDDAWRPLVLARFLTLEEPPPASWRAHFLSQRGKQCRSRGCTAISDYVFPLLGASYRLCERCEAADPAYALLTAAQAADGFRLSAEELSSLPSREVRGLRSRAVEKRLRMLGQATLYLRSHVVALAAERDKAHFDDSGDESNEDPEAEEEQFALDDVEDEGAPARRRAPAQSAEEARAARKANKAAVKAANRERRQSKAAALASPAEPRRTYAALSRSPGASLPPRPGSSPQQSGAFRAGASPGLRTPGRGSKAAHARDAARALQAGISPNSGGVLARASLEQELGEFGISGLERAD